jgi:hypothetical protein
MRSTLGGEVSHGSWITLVVDFAVMARSMFDRLPEIDMLTVVDYVETIAISGAE